MTAEPGHRDTTVDEREVERFSRLAAQWWDPHGKMAVLHKFNPVRLAYIREPPLISLMIFEFVSPFWSCLGLAQASKSRIANLRRESALRS